MPNRKSMCFKRISPKFAHDLKKYNKRKIQSLGKLNLNRYSILNLSTGRIWTIVTSRVIPKYTLIVRTLTGIRVYG